MIDQDAVNELVDYAIAHGVNYFDTSPMYVQGWSEKSTGIALKRHPRESFYLATKLSNFHPDTWTREGSIAMYRKSFEDMQVDYIDYYLLHMIGGGGMEQFRKRYIDNGMIDFLSRSVKQDASAVWDGRSTEISKSMTMPCRCMTVVKFIGTLYKYS